MRPRDSGETTMMLCCGEKIEFYVKAIQEDNRAFAFAIWKCNECFTAFWQRLAEIHPEGANGETTSMVCSGEEIECMLEVHRERHGAVAIAVWHCDLCSTTFWQPLGEIRSEGSKPIIIGDGTDESIETGDGPEEEAKRTFRVINGS